MDVATPARITAETKLNDVLARYPATAPVFTQGRRLYVDQLHDLYARFPGLTVGDFARPERPGPGRGAAPGQRPRRVRGRRAAARDAREGPDEARAGQFSLTLGYTASYRPREDSAPDSVSVVAVQSSRGPE